MATKSTGGRTFRQLNNMTCGVIQSRLSVTVLLAIKATLSEAQYSASAGSPWSKTNNLSDEVNYAVRIQYKMMLTDDLSPSKSRQHTQISSYENCQILLFHYY